MGYPKEVYDQAWETLSRRKAENREHAARRREEIRQRIPAISKIEAEMACLGGNIARTVITQPDSASSGIEKLKLQSLALQEHKAQLLEKAGYPRDYLDERYTCRICKDTGYTGTKMCECLSALLKNAAATRLGASAPVKNCTFANFALDYYPDTPDASGVIPKQRMGQILEACLSYAQGFSHNAESLLLLGQTGLGKTHLSLAIAIAVTEAGFGVVYTPVQKLMDRLEAEKFSRRQETREQYSDSMEYILGCDFLVLDDLGTEFHTQFTISTLYNIINTRLVENRPTIISTNLEISEIEDKYSQRMVSRLVCSYKVLKFYGRDIRFMKKQIG